MDLGKLSLNGFWLAEIIQNQYKIIPVGGHNDRENEWLLCSKSQRLW